ncbi:MAG: universal stress protein [Pseudomonadota bacterium]
MYGNLLIAIDGSELSMEALRNGVKLAQSLGASIVIATVTEKWSALEVAAQVRCGENHPIERYEEAAREAAARILELAKSLADELNAECRVIHVADQHPATGIVALAKEQGCDLIIMGSHGRSGLEKALLGSVAQNVLTLSPVPVLIDKAASVN